MIEWEDDGRNSWIASSKKESCWYSIFKPLNELDFYSAFFYEATEKSADCTKKEHMIKSLDEAKEVCEKWEKDFLNKNKGEQHES